MGKKALMCITGRILGNHTKSLVGNKNHSFEYNGKTICVEKGKEAYSITLIDVDGNRDDEELVEMFQSGFFGKQVDDLNEVFIACCLEKIRPTTNYQQKQMMTDQALKSHQSQTSFHYFS